MVTDLGALCVRVDYRTSMTITPSSAYPSVGSVSQSTPHSAPISFKGSADKTAGGGGGGGGGVGGGGGPGDPAGGGRSGFRPRCDTSSSNRISDESEEHGGGVTSDDSQDRIFHADPVNNTPQHQQSRYDVCLSCRLVV